MSEPLRFEATGDPSFCVIGDGGTAITIKPNGDVWVNEAACETIIVGNHDVTATAFCRAVLAALDGRVKRIS